MTTPFWCLLVIVLMPYFIAPLVGWQRVRQFGTADNKNPRQQQAKLAGLGARAQAAESNAFEAMPVFASAVLVSHLAQAPAGSASTLALLFVAIRVAHAACYLADLDKLRSLAFLVGLGCCIGLFVISA